MNWLVCLLASLAVSSAAPAPYVQVYYVPVYRTVVPQGRSLDAMDTQEVVELEEASQFHSQDGQGQFLFGYSIPNQARIEGRSLDGTVRGSYSYIDPTGKEVKVRYQADRNGFKAAGNNLPEHVMTGVPQQVADTPAVVAARELHFQLYEQALAAAEAAGPGDDSGAYVEEHEPEDQNVRVLEDSVLIESDNSAVDDVQEEDMQVDINDRYPKLQFAQNLYDPSHIHDPSKNAVIVNNPELPQPGQFRTQFRTRTGKSGLGVPQMMPVERTVTPKKPGGFFYSYHHTVPVYVQVVGPKSGDHQQQPNLSVSQKAAFFGAIPVAAVHDVQVSPHQKQLTKNYQILPVYLDTQGN